eukprot:762626-Hanusia_phi.AAC.4
MPMKIGYRAAEPYRSLGRQAAMLPDPETFRAEVEKHDDHGGDVVVVKRTIFTAFLMHLAEREWVKQRMSEDADFNRIPHNFEVRILLVSSSSSLRALTHS